MDRRSFIGVALPAMAFAQEGALSSTVTSTKVAIIGFHILNPTLGAPSASIDIAIKTRRGRRNWN